MNLSLVAREWARGRRSGSWALGGALFVAVHGLYFALILTSLGGSQPLAISPLRWLWGGDLLILQAILLPLLLVKAFAEERQGGTWDSLFCSGASPLALIWQKYLGVCLQWLLWITGLSVPALVVAIYGQEPLAQIFWALAGQAMVGMLALALGTLVVCRSRSSVVAYGVATVALLLALALPYGKLLLPDPFYRIFFDTLDLKALLNRTSTGVVLGTDLVLVLGSIPIFLWMAAVRLEAEMGLSRMGKVLNHLSTGLMVLVLYVLLFLFHLRPWHHDISLEIGRDVSKDYQAMMEGWQGPLEVTVVLPKTLPAVNSYAEVRTLILAFLNKTRALAPQVNLRELDPDIDLIEMERLAQGGIKGRSRIGFVLVEGKGHSVVLSYHQWFTLGTLTIDNEARRFVRSFHGESLMARALNVLSRQGRQVRTLVLSGSQELDLGSDQRLGGSLFAETLQQMGLALELRRPGIDELDLDRYALVLSLDPRDDPGPTHQKLFEEIRQRELPLLALRGAFGHHSDEDPLLDFGVEVKPHVLYQREYESYDPFTLPLHQMSDHPIVKELQGQRILADALRPVLPGVPLDPRWVGTPLLRAEQLEGVWGELNLDLSSPNTAHTFGPGDLASPLPVAMVVDAKKRSGTRPVALVVGTRAPFENRFFLEAANRRFVFHCVDALLESEGKVKLPPRAPRDHRFDLPPERLAPLRWLVLLTGPLAFLLMGFVGWRRSR